MSRRDPLRLEIASPCKAEWSAMSGDDAVRHCGDCKKNVYNLSEMTTGQVEALLREAGETPCVRFYQRRDGTVITGDCPVGAKRVRRKRAFAGLGAGALAAFGLAVGPGGASQAPAEAPPQPVMGAVPEMSVKTGKAHAPEEPAKEIEPEVRPVMGEPAMPPSVDR